jgi:phospholipid transport system transporter-binding protein
MPGADPAIAVRRDGDTLRFEGALEAGAIARLWKPALALLDGVRRFDLTAVARVDSAGVALLAELAARAGDVAVDGDPDGLPALRAAYRLAPSLAFA